MNREEKNILTKRKILDSAISEFAAHGLEAASMNTICQNGGISKGIIYHYFDSKDALYLACLKECFQVLTEKMQECLSKQPDETDFLTIYFQSRLEFFHHHREFARLFCYAVVFPPAHLKDDIQKIRQEFDRMNDAYLYRILKNNSVRSDLTEKDILRSFHKLQDFLNTELSTQTNEQTDIETHETESRKMLDIFLYGIMERK